MTAGLVRACALALAALVAGCGPYVQEIGPDIVAPRLLPDALITPDGSVLPMRRWQPDPDIWPEPSAVVIALHGYNDYSFSFELPATDWVEDGILTYAYDQRGFGATRDVGVWGGTDAMIADAQRAVALARETHPGVPIILMGESMGGAMAVAAAAEATDPKALPDGLVLVAPALWGRPILGGVATAITELMARLLPFLPLTSEGLGITPSDNYELLRQMAEDPLVLKEARTDSIFGLVGLMDRAYQDLPAIGVPMLVLYGDNEDVLPSASVDAAKARIVLCLEETGPACAPQFNDYPDGFHLLLRDLNRAPVIEDVAAWIAERG